MNQAGEFDNIASGGTQPDRMAVHVGGNPRQAAIKDAVVAGW
jgi:hypothetical protein